MLNMAEPTIDRTEFKGAIQKVRVQTRATAISGSLQLFILQQFARRFKFQLEFVS